MISNQDAISHLSLDVSTELLFGFAVNSGKNGLPYPHFAKHGSPAEASFADAFTTAQTVIAVRGWSGNAWPLREILVDQTAQPMSIVNKFLDPIVDQAIARNNAQNQDDREAETLVDELIRSTQGKSIQRESIQRST